MNNTYNHIRIIYTYYIYVLYIRIIYTYYIYVLYIRIIYTYYIYVSYQGTYLVDLITNTYMYHIYASYIRFISGKALMNNTYNHRSKM